MRSFRRCPAPNLAGARGRLPRCATECAVFAIYRNGISTSNPGNPRGTLLQLQIALAPRGSSTHGVEPYVGRCEGPLDYRDGAQGYGGALAYWTRTPN